MAANDLMSTTTLKSALGVTGTTRDTEVQRVITAVSTALDALVGPIIRRTVTTERHRGGASTVTLRHPVVHSVSAVVEYDGTSSTSLTEDTPGTQNANGFRLTPRNAPSGLYGPTVTRTANGAVSVFDPTWVTVTYSAGRYENAAAVDARFVEAAVATAKTWWRQYETTVGEVGEFDVAYQSFPAGFGIPRAARDLLAGEWLGEADPMTAGVLIG